MDNKITISRSFSKKVVVAPYETEDHFSSKSIEVPVDTSYEEQEQIARALFLMCGVEVYKEVEEMKKLRDENGNKISAKQLEGMLDKVKKGQPNLLDDYLNLDGEQEGKIQEAKKAWKRAEYAKDKELIKDKG